MFVIARNRTFIYKAKPVKIKQVGEGLGVRYVLEGSVLKSGDRLRISAQLIDALKGHHVWAETYDRDERDLFTTLDDVTLAISKELAVRLLPSGQASISKQADTKSIEAWSLYIKANHYDERLSKEDNAKARELAEQAIEIDPNYDTLSLAWMRRPALTCRRFLSTIPVLRVTVAITKNRKRQLRGRNFITSCGFSECRCFSQCRHPKVKVEQTSKKDARTSKKPLNYL